MGQWLRIHLPVQGTQVRSQFQEDQGASKPMYHNCRAHVQQLPKPESPELRSAAEKPPNERPTHRSRGVGPAPTARESPPAAVETQHSQKEINTLLEKRFTLITSHLAHHNAPYTHPWSLLLPSTLPSRTIFLKCDLSLPLKLLHGSPGIFLRALQLLTLMFRVSSSTSPPLPLLPDLLTPVATTQPNIRRKQWPPTPVLLPGKSHGQRSLVGCGSWGC